LKKPRERRQKIRGGPKIQNVKTLGKFRMKKKAKLVRGGKRNM